VPAARAANELQFERQEKADGPDLVRCWLQKAPARQLPNLQKMPIVIVNGEASFHAPFEHCTVRYLEQAGAKPTWIDLGKAGIHGNGHMVMLERNSDEVARAIAAWLDKAVPERTASR
jgi:pimeloyl-ACP methyl ester carboxylesterase